MYLALTFKRTQTQIRPGFDEELDRMKNVLEDLPDILQSVGKASFYLRCNAHTASVTSCR